MGEYPRQPGDKAYRKVHLFVEGVPDFDEFTVNGERICYNEDEVLEVMTESGETTLHYHTKERKVLYYNFPDKGVLKIACDDKPGICARLWVRKTTSQTAYKLPATLPIGSDGKLCATVSGNTGDMVLVGDQYLSRVYNPVRTG